MEMDWTKVVTEPLGLAAFAVALIFASRRRGATTPRWWPPTAIGLALVCVIGGLLLFYARIQLDHNNVTAADSSTATVPAEQNASATGGGSTAGNINGSGDSIGARPASMQPSSANPAEKASVTTSAPVNQTAVAHDGGTAINVNGNGNSVDVPPGH